MVGLPSSSVFVQRGKPFVPSRARDEGTPVAGVEELSVGRLARRTTTQHAPRWAVRVGSQARVLTGGCLVKGSRQAVDRRADLLKVQTGSAGGGDVQAVGLLGCATEDAVEDAGRVEGGCSARQPPGMGWVTGQGNRAASRQGSATQTSTA